MSPEEIKRRTRLNSGDFPPLHSAGEKGSPREEEQAQPQVQVQTQTQVQAQVTVPETEKHLKSNRSFLNLSKI